MSILSGYKKVKSRISGLIIKIFGQEIWSYFVRLKHAFFPKPETFTRDHYLKRAGWDNFQNDYFKIARAIDQNLKFESILDLGCGNGFLLKPLMEMNYNVEGIEISPDVKDVVSEDLKKVITIGDFTIINKSYDLVCCIEVAEHIEPFRSKELVATLTEYAKEYIFFTAAPPNQSGHGHINCRKHSEWIRFYNNQNWTFDKELTKRIKTNLSDLKRTDYIRDNLLIFRPTNFNK